MRPVLKSRNHVPIIAAEIEVHRRGEAEDLALAMLVPSEWEAHHLRHAPMIDRTPRPHHPPQYQNGGTIACSMKIPTNAPAHANIIHAMMIAKEMAPLIAKPRPSHRGSYGPHANRCRCCSD